MSDKTVTVTIWNAGASSIHHYMTAGPAFDRGDIELLNFGATHYIVRFANGAAPIIRRRIHDSAGRSALGARRIPQL